MFFDKNKVSEAHLNFLNPYIKKSLDIFNNLDSYNELTESIIEDIDELHRNVLNNSIENVQNNKLKTIGKVLLSNPYSSRLKVEKLPAPNLYTALIFSNLWVAKLSGLYVDKWIDEIPGASVNENNDIDKDLVLNKIMTSLEFIGQSYFGDKKGRKTFKDFRDYENTPFGSKFMILAAFIWHPLEVNDAIISIIKSVKKQDLEG